MTPRLNFDQFSAALYIWRIAGYAPQQVMDGIWHVILNRVTDDKARWPRSIHQIVQQLAKGIDEKWPNEVDTLGWEGFLKACDVVFTSLGDDPTGDATYFLYAGCQMELPTTDTRMTVQLSPFQFFKHQ